MSPLTMSLPEEQAVEEVASGVVPARELAVEDVASADVSAEEQTVEGGASDDVSAGELAVEDVASAEERAVKKADAGEVVDTDIVDEGAEPQEPTADA